MRAYKCQCSLFKDYYRDYQKCKVDEETKVWMTKHKEECSFCKEWAKSFEENREDIVINNSVRKSGVRKEKDLAEKVKSGIPLGVVKITFAAIWMSFKRST